MNFLLSIFKIVVAAAILLGAAIYFFQYKLIFYPDTLAQGFQFKFKNTSEEKWLTVGGKKVNALYFPMKQAPGVIIYFHGNAQSLEQWGHVASDLVDKTGWGVFIVDYPGYGKSEGPLPSESELYALGDAAFAEVKKLEPHKSILIYGRSLGSVVAVDLASRNNIQGMILETPLYDTAEMAKKILPEAPGFLIRYHFLSHQKINKVLAPVYFIHGTDDTLIPIDHGKMLFNAFQGKKEFLEIPGGGHNNLSQTNPYWPGVVGFVKKIR